MSNVWRGRGTTLGMTLLVAVCVIVPAGLAFGQVDESRIGRFAVDVHGVTGGFGPTPEQAAALGYADTDLPGRGFGWDLGGQIYFAKVGTITLGAGGNIVRLAGDSDPKDVSGISTGNKATTRFRSFATQVTANFGRRKGWSYLSAGYGVSTFGIWKSADLETTSLSGVPSPPSRPTLNFGFGARWFMKEHVAFSFDVRFYKLGAQEATETAPADAKQTRIVIGAGVSFR